MKYSQWHTCVVWCGLDTHNICPPHTHTFKNTLTCTHNKLSHGMHTHYCAHNQHTHTFCTHMQIDSHTNTHLHTHTHTFYKSVHILTDALMPQLHLCRATPPSSSVPYKASRMLVSLWSGPKDATWRVWTLQDLRPPSVQPSKGRWWWW